MQDIEAKTWPKFLEIIREEKKKLSGADELWYRGQSRTHYSLIPSLLRQGWFADLEQEVFAEYKKNANRLGMEQPNDWFYLADMQHYGIPTRLLDWTKTLGVALTFALLDGDDAEDSAIYLLDPKRLNAESGIDRVRHVPEDKNAYEYQAMYFEARPLKPKTPIAIECNFRNSRIAAQNGTFTVHGSDKNPFDHDRTVYGSKIVLKAASKEGVRQFLEHASMNEYTIYPDIVGMAGYSRRKYFA